MPVLVMMLVIFMMLGDNDDHAYDDDDDDDDVMMVMMLLRKLNLTPDPTSVCSNALECKLCLILCITVYFFLFNCVISMTICRR